jgi:AraC-like DNA-binding protein
MNPIFEKINKPDNQSFYLEEVIRPYFPDPWHFHREIEILYIRDAYGTKYIGDSIGLFSQGDVVIIGSDTPHLWASDSVYSNPGNQLMSNAVVILFLEDIIGKSFKSIPEFYRIMQFLNESKRGIQFIDKTRIRLIKHIEALSSRNGMDRLIGLLKILDIMSTSNDIKYLSAPDYKSLSINSEDKDRIESIVSYVIQNYPNKIYLKDIASNVNLTAHSFCRYFKSRTGKVFSSFVNEVRIGNSCKMIIENKGPISQICYMSGFNYLSNFYRQFKKIKGMTPFQFQSRYAKQDIDTIFEK